MDPKNSIYIPTPIITHPRGEDTPLFISTLGGGNQRDLWRMLVGGD